MTSALKGEGVSWVGSKYYVAKEAVTSSQNAVDPPKFLGRRITNGPEYRRQQEEIRKHLRSREARSCSHSLDHPFIDLASDYSPLASRHSSLDPKTPVAVMVSLQMTPLYGLCMKPATAKREEKGEMG